VGPAVLLLADTPAAAADLVPPDALHRCSRDAMPRDLRTAWGRLAGDVDAWSATLDLPQPARAPRRALLAVERADGSQFSALQAALREGAPLPPDLTCLALEGTGFRGQRGRAWAAVRGNLHVCLLAALGLPAASVQAALTALPAVAAARAVERATAGRLRPGLKWVNDLVIAERKIGGVLSATLVQGTVATHVLVGIGISVQATPAVPRHPSAPAAGSLAELAPAVAPSLATLTVALLGELDAAVAEVRAGRGDALIESYRRRSVVVGRRVAIWPVDADTSAHRPTRIGRVRRLRQDLGLELEGSAEPVHTGRLTLLEDGRDTERGSPEDG
jgi:BirA family transcriptional regulator, biotin operon repressor / biotin---[acetyl-CoA-carboxylase] ligase